jgi:uncharacterized membrane protein
MKRLLLLVCLSYACASGASSSPPPATRSLSSSEMSSLSRGEVVVVLEPTSAGPWPKVTVLRKLPVPPDVVSGVFLDYESAPRFMDKLESARVTSTRARVQEVEYRVRLPVLMSVAYKTRNSYAKEGDRHIVRWELLESSLASSGSGEFSVEPWGTGSLMVYSSMVVPANRLVASLKNLAIEEVRSTASALASESIRRAAAR